jgi:hypothetical protein
MPDSDLRRIVVKFKDDLVDANQPDSANAFLNRLRQENEWKHLEPQFNGITIERMFKALGQSKFLELVARAIPEDGTYKPPNFLTYFAVLCPPNVNPENVLDTFSSSWWRSKTEFAYMAARGSLPAVRNPGNNPRWSYHDTDYLKKAPAGIDANYAWAFKGGDGGDGNIRLVDIESDWDLTHSELPGGVFMLPVGHRYNFWDGLIWAADHGTRVLGIIVAKDNTDLSLGITPNLNPPMVACAWRYVMTGNYSGWLFEPEEAITVASYYLRNGDVILLEVESDTNSGGYLPVEHERHVFHAIQLATRRNVVIEAAGNWHHDLGNIGVPWLNRNNPQFEDSGAVLVSAASPWVNGGSSSKLPDYIHEPMSDSSTGQRAHNYGNRIDCYAWGDAIYTTQLGGGGANFGATSGASAIIAGASLAIQGIRKVKRKNPFAPSMLRRILSSPTENTSSHNPSVDKLGVMPNLNRIYRKYLRRWPWPF